MLRDLKSQSSDISQLVAITSSLPSSLRNELEGVRRSLGGQPADLVHAISQQIQTLPMDKCTLQQESALRVLQSLPLNPSSLSMTLQQKDLSDPFQNLKTSYKPHLKLSSMESRHEMSTYGVHSNNRQPSQDLLHPWAETRGPKRRRRATRSFTEYWDLAVYKCTFGRMTVRKISQRMEENACRKQDHQSSIAITFTLYPAPWIADKIIELGFGLRSSGRESSSISWSLGSCSYNQNPILVNCLHNGDISRLKSLFASGEAKPTDILVPWGNSFLHVSHLVFVFESEGLLTPGRTQEAVYNSLSTNTDSMELCKFLIEQGADLNVRSLNGRYVVA